MAPEKAFKERTSADLLYLANAVVCKLLQIQNTSFTNEESLFLATKVVLVIFVALVIHFIAPVTFVVALHTPPASMLPIRGDIACHDPMSKSGQNVSIQVISRPIFNKYLIY
jgi:hypothetical protein